MNKIVSAFLMLAMLATVAAHYGDPNDGGCEKDEQPVKINGLAGDFCSPPCSSSGACPTDVPPGVTATNSGCGQFARGIHGARAPLRL